MEVSTTSTPDTERVATTTPKVSEDYTLCNCASYLRTRGVPIQGVDAVWFKTFNGVTPQEGGIVILQYLVDGEDVYHVSYIEKVLEQGVWVSETNYKRCQYTERLIEWGDPHIVKFLVL